MWSIQLWGPCNPTTRILAPSSPMFSTKPVSHRSGHLQGFPQKMGSDKSRFTRETRRRKTSYYTCLTTSCNPSLTTSYDVVQRRAVSSENRIRFLLLDDVVMCRASLESRNQRNLIGLLWENPVSVHTRDTTSYNTLSVFILFYKVM